MMSSPAPPQIRSFPSPPSIWSLPPRAWITSSPEVPTMTSSASVPTIVATRSSIPTHVTTCARAVTASPSNEISMTTLAAQAAAVFAEIGRMPPHSFRSRSRSWSTIHRTTRLEGRPGRASKSGHFVRQISWIPEDGRQTGQRSAVSASISDRRGDGEETGDGQDHRDARQPAERSDEQRGSVGHRSDAVLASNRVRLRVGDGSSQQSPTAGTVPPQTVPHDRQDEERARIHCRGHIRIRLSDVIGDQRCVEYREDDKHQEDAVEEHESAVDFPDVVEHVVMVHPHDEDAHEARHKGEERGPFIDEALGERNATRGGIAKVQREQGDREREYPIAERLHSDGFLLLDCLAVHHLLRSCGARIGSI